MLAPGSPGAPPSWGPGLKQAFGSAPGLESKVWFTLARGNLSEVFFPSLRQPTLHELRFLVAAPGAPPVDDAAEADHSLRWLRPGVPAFSVFSSHDEYHLSLNFVVDPDRSALLIAGAFNPELPDLRLYLMATPHVVPGSEGNEAEVLALDPPVLLARQGDIHIALVGPCARGRAEPRRQPCLPPGLVARPLPPGHRAGRGGRHGARGARPPASGQDAAGDRRVAPELDPGWPAPLARGRAR